MSAASYGQSAGVAAGHAASASRGRRAARNLQVLPQDISAAALNALMKQYSKGLGVSCAFCHVKDPKTGHLDYAADGNPHKQIARLMITMLREINTQYLSRIGDPRYPTRVTCGNCHQGESHPPDFEALEALQ